MAVVDRFGDCFAAVRHKRLKNIGSDLGGAVKGFKGAMKKGEEEADQAKLEEADKDDVIEGEATVEKKEKS